jgi:hypothetical protein
MSRVRGVVNLVAMLSVATGFPALAPAQTPQSGTYRLWLCATVCSPADSARAIGVATIVVFDDSAATSERVVAVLKSFRVARRAKEGAGPANVCVHVTRHKS